MWLLFFVFFLRWMRGWGKPNFFFGGVWDVGAKTSLFFFVGGRGVCKNKQNFLGVMKTYISLSVFGMSVFITVNGNEGWVR